MIVLLLFAALIGPYFIDWTSYRQDFEREASRILGQKVEVLGSAEARLLPFPSVTFNNVRVENARTGAPMMTIAHFSMDAELAPFLRGELLIFDMRIDEPTATVRLLPDGTLDWALRSSETLPTSSVKLENVEITNGTIDLVDEQNDRTRQVSGLNATVSADDLAGPWRMEGTGALDGHRGAFSLATGVADASGHVRLRVRLLPDKEPVSLEAEGDASFDENKPHYDGQFTLQVLDLAAISGQPERPAAKTGDKPAVARATGRFALDNTRLAIDEYRLEVGPTDDPYVVTGAATIDTGKSPGFMLTADGQQIDIDQLNDTRVGFGGDPSGKKSRTPPKLTPADRLAILHRIASLIPIPPMPGKATIKLPALVAGDTTVRSIEIEAEPSGDAWKIDHFVGKFPGRTQVEAKGRLMLGRDFGFSGHLLVAAKQPSGLADWLTGRVDPQIRLVDGAGFSADVLLTAGAQRFENLEFAIGPSTIRGKFERTVPTQGRPKVVIDLAGDDIDLDAMRALASLFTGDRNGLSLAGQDVTARLKADRFEMFGAQARDVDTAFSYHAGAIDVSRLNIGNLAGAALSADGRIDGLGGAIAGEAHADIAARDPKPFLNLLQVLGGKNVVLAHVAAAAEAFDNTHLKATAKISGGALKLDVTGDAGGSALTVALRRSSLTGMAGTVPITLELTAQNPSVNKLLGQVGFRPLPIDAPGPGLLSMRIDGTPRSGARVAVDLSGADTSFKANGTLAFAEAADGRLSVGLKSDDLTPYLIMNGIGLPDTVSGLPVDLDATVALGAGKVSASGIKGEVAGNAVGGNLTLTLGDHPAIAGELSLDTLDAGWFARLVLGPDAIEGPDGAWSRDDFAPPQDFGVAIDVGLAAKQAFLGLAAPATGLKGDVSFDAGTLDFSDVTAAWLGGRLAGSLHLANSNGSGLLRTQISLKDADLGKAIQAGPSAPAMTGGLTFSVSVDGSGRSARALVDGLSGSGTVSITDLAVPGIRTDGFRGILAAADDKDFKISAESTRQLAERAIAGGVFRPGDVSIPFTVAGGTAKFSNVAMADPNVTVTGNGAADLSDRTLAATFTMAFKPTDNDYAGATPAVTLAYNGPIAAPKRSIDAAELSNYLSLRAYEIQRRKVELLQAGVLQKQRLRREIDLLRAEAEARARAKAIEFEEKRRRAAAHAAYMLETARAAAAREAAEEAARKKAEAEAAGAANSNDASPAAPAPDKDSGPADNPGAGDGHEGNPIDLLPKLDLQFPL